ncbi:MAG: DUF433 domain-containing protein [Desulfobacteraceae bacterium]|nr:DUF433 domain-containing protein [Desulfobacteraceae bacterium]
MGLKLTPLNFREYYEIIGNGVVRLKGFRIGIEHIIRSYQEGYTPEQIIQEFPGVSLETVYATLTYYLHNKKEVDDYINELTRWTEQQMKKDDEKEPLPVVQRLRRLKEKNA